VVRFTTDVAIVPRLGRELVAKQETALGELVKNAYDADATFCTVNLEERGEASALEIVDDGSGMSLSSDRRRRFGSGRRSGCQGRRRRREAGRGGADLRSRLGTAHP
jgi:signal transduction histidine kinase